MILNSKFLTLAVLALTFSVKANAISYSAATNGTVAPAGLTFNAVGGNLGIKSVTDTNVSPSVTWASLGVVSGRDNVEIDVGQALTATFTQAQVITTLDLGLLFASNDPWHDYFEIADIQVNNSAIYSLKAIGTNSTTWTGLGTVKNLSLANGKGAAVWEITNPFGTQAITSLKFYPVNSAEYTLSKDSKKSGSDFGLVGFTTKNVPDATSSLSLMAIALLGLGFLGRRNRRS